MRRCCLVLLAMIGLLAATATPSWAIGGPAEAPAPTRTEAAPIQGVDSMWVWHSRPAADLVSTAEALGVVRVFLFVGNRDHAADRNLMASVRLLHDHGIEVFALSGEPGWTKRHGPAVIWAHRALGLAPFDGLHLDVEPHALKHWKQHQQALAADYLDLLDEIGPLTDHLEVDVQFAYGKVNLGDGSNFADDILTRVDGVTVMSYRDTAVGGNGMLTIAEDWLERGDAAQRPVWLAAETNQESDCPYCTFFEEGQADMASVLESVDATEAPAHPTYQGIAIEDLDGWLALGP